MEDNRIVALTFFTAIPGKVVPVSVVVIFAIEFIVLVLIADKIAQGKTVMRGNEIDTTGWSLLKEKIRRSA